LPIADLAEAAIEAGEVIVWFNLLKPEATVTEVLGWDQKRG